MTSNLNESKDKIALVQTGIHFTSEFILMKINTKTVEIMYKVILILSIIISYSIQDEFNHTNTTAEPIEINVESDEIKDLLDESQIENETTSNANIEFQIEGNQKVRQIQPDQIKEDDKNGTLESVVTRVDSVVRNTLSRNNKSENGALDLNIGSTTSTPQFSPSPYLGSVIEEVIEEPIAQQRAVNLETNFIPMRSRESNMLNQLLGEVYLSRQYPTFQTGSTVVPVLPVYGESYALHADDSINDDLLNPNFNENPFGQIRFPDEKSKYFPIFLTENEINKNEDKPLKFDYDGNYKQYDFPYKIENTGSAPLGNTIQDITSPLPDVEKIVYPTMDNVEHTVHGQNIMKNLNATLPLETKKSHPKKYPHSTWKKVAHTVMAFLPIGLMLAAIPPKVIKTNMTSYYPGRQSVTLPQTQNLINPYKFKGNINSRRTQRKNISK